MARSRRRGPGALHGLILVDKPLGPTSFAVMRDVARRLDAGRSGHAGTLDPAASGLLLVLLGEATKAADWLVGCDKVYAATVALGSATDTCDREGSVIVRVELDPAVCTAERVEAALTTHRGAVLQVPPAYAAVKQGGRTLMSRARAGEVVDAAPRAVTCHDLELLAVRGTLVDLRVHCSKGYYVRALARDLGETLGVPAHLHALRRLRVGSFDVGDACVPEAALASRVLPLALALGDLAQIHLDAETATLVAHGRPVPASGAAERALLLGPEGLPLCLATREGGTWRVARGFNLPQPGQGGNADPCESSSGARPI